MKTYAGKSLRGFTELAPCEVKASAMILLGPHSGLFTGGAGTTRTRVGAMLLDMNTENFGFGKDESRVYVYDEDFSLQNRSLYQPRQFSICNSPRLCTAKKC